MWPLLGRIAGYGSAAWLGHDVGAYAADYFGSKKKKDDGTRMPPGGGVLAPPPGSNDPMRPLYPGGGRLDQPIAPPSPIRPNPNTPSAPAKPLPAIPVGTGAKSRKAGLSTPPVKQYGKKAPMKKKEAGGLGGMWKAAQPYAPYAIGALGGLAVSKLLSSRKNRGPRTTTYNYYYR